MRWSVGAKSAKAERVRESLRATKERRLLRRPVVYQLKLQNLSKAKKRHLDQAFREAKWLYNWLVSDLERLSFPVYTVDREEVKVGDRFEERRLSVLGSQIKQGLAERIGESLRALAELKRKGHPVGPLRPKRFLGSIFLKQYGKTDRLDFGRNRARVQKLGEFRVLGLHQILPGAEIASAVLVKKPSGCAGGGQGSSQARRGHRDRPRGGLQAHPLQRASGGLRLPGDPEAQEAPKSARHNEGRLPQPGGPEGPPEEGGRADGQSAQGGLPGRPRGGVESALRLSDPSLGDRGTLPTPRPVARFEATTQKCFACGRRQRLSLSEREMRCLCGWTRHRDWNAALVALRKGLGLSPDQAVGLDRPELTPLEREAARRILGSNPGIRLVSLAEGGSPPLERGEEVTIVLPSYRHSFVC